MNPQSFRGRLDRFDSKLWGHHFMVPVDISNLFIKAKIKRVICTLEGETSFHSGLMPAGDDRYFINVNAEIRKKTGWRIGEHRQVTLRPDTSKYGMEMPVELEELLRQDDEGDRYFHALTPGKQRNLIYIAGKPKRPSTRLTKSLIIVDYLKTAKGELNFKDLYRDLKERKDEF